MITFNTCRKICALAVALSLALSATAPAFAKSDDELIVDAMIEQAGRSAVQQLGEDAVKDMVDATWQTTPPAAGEQSIGQETVAWIKVGVSAIEFGNAKNDKQRLYAGLDVAVGVVAVANPAAGLVASLALLAVKLIDTGFSISHAKEMLAIGERTQKEIAAYTVLVRQMAKGDSTRILGWIDATRAEYKALEELGEKIQAECGSLGENSTIEELDNCRVLSSQVFPRAQNWLNLSRQVLDFDSQYVDLKILLEKKMHTTEKDFRAQLEKNKLELEESQKAMAQAFDDLGRQIARLAVARARAEGNLDPVLELRNRCYTAALRFNRQGNLALVRANTRPSEEARRQVTELYAVESSTFDGGCVDLAAGEQDPLFQHLVVREQTLAAMEAFVFSEAKPAER